MRVLVACEFSGIVREAFKARGHDAWSCDLLDTEIPGNHIQGNVLEHLDKGWDLMIAHPPCTYLAVSGSSHFKEPGMEVLQLHALTFVNTLLLCTKIKKIALENPVSIISTHIRKPDQIIQPYQFGHGEIKTTCLWLKQLPLLKPTKLVSGRHSKILAESPSKDRWKNRSRTYTGIAAAMAEQWG